MSANEPMTQGRLDAIQERLDAVESDPPDEDWAYGSGVAWVPFCEHAREDVPALLAEVERLRALTTVDDDMVVRVARALHAAGEALGELSWDDEPEMSRRGYRRLVRAMLDAALDTQEEA